MSATRRPPAWSDIERDLLAPGGRVTPRCRHFTTCGGCDLQHISYDEQRRLKREWLVRVLAGLVPAARIAPCLDARADGVVPPPPPVRGTRPPDDPPWGFRHKVHFVFAQDRGRLALAHYARGGRELVPIEDCPAHAAVGNRVARHVCDALDAAGLRAFPYGPLRHVVVRVARASGRALVTLVVTDAADPRLRRAVGRLPDREAVSVAVNLNPDDSPYLFGRETRHVTGPRHLIERVGGLAYRLSPTSFFQTNVDAAAVLVRLLRARLAGAPPLSVVDLYAGVGLFALQLAAAGHRVLAVEENPAAVADGLESQRALRIGASRCRFVRESVRRVTTWSRHVRGTVDLVVLDPPRDGVGGELLRRILETLTPRQVAYVSCDPVSLAVDLEALRSPGAALPYDIDVVEPVDMFPHTAHLETFAWIVRREPTTAARAAGRTTTARPGGRSRSDRGTRTDRDAPPARRRRTR